MFCNAVQHVARARARPDRPPKILRDPVFDFFVQLFRDRANNRIREALQSLSNETGTHVVKAGLASWDRRFHRREDIMIKRKAKATPPIINVVLLKPGIREVDGAAPVAAAATVGNAPVTVEITPRETQPYMSRRTYLRK